MLTGRRSEADAVAGRHVDARNRFRVLREQCRCGSVRGHRVIEDHDSFGLVDVRQRQQVLAKFGTELFQQTVLVGRFMGGVGNGPYLVRQLQKGLVVVIAIQGIELPIHPVMPLKARLHCIEMSRRTVTRLLGPWCRRTHDVVDVDTDRQRGKDATKLIGLVDSFVAQDALDIFLCWSCVPVAEEVDDSVGVKQRLDLQIYIRNGMQSCIHVRLP